MCPACRGAWGLIGSSPSQRTIASSPTTFLSATPSFGIGKSLSRNCPNSCPIKPNSHTGNRGSRLLKLQEAEISSKATKTRKYSSNPGPYRLGKSQEPRQHIAPEKITHKNDGAGLIVAGGGYRSGNLTW